MSLLKYIGIAYVPLTLFLLLIVFFHINIFSPRLSCVVVICQILTSPIFLRGFVNNNSNSSGHYVQFLATVYGIWNLDFFRTVISPICLPLDTLQVMALDYIVAIYPMFLLLFFYAAIALYDRNNRLVVCLLKPLIRLSLCCRKQWDIKSSVIDSFASFVLLGCMNPYSSS